RQRRRRIAPRQLEWCFFPYDLVLRRAARRRGPRPARPREARPPLRQRDWVVGRDAALGDGGELLAARSVRVRHGGGTRAWERPGCGRWRWLGRERLRDRMLLSQRRGSGRLLLQWLDFE